MPPERCASYASAEVVIRQEVAGEDVLRKKNYRSAPRWEMA